MFLRPSSRFPVSFASSAGIPRVAAQKHQPCAFVCRRVEDGFDAVVLKGGPAQVAIQTAEKLSQASRAVEKVGTAGGYVTGGVAGALAGVSLLACRMQRGHDAPLKGLGFRVAIRRGFHFGYALGKAPTAAVCGPLNALAWGLQRAQGG